MQVNVEQRRERDGGEVRATKDVSMLSLALAVRGRAGEQEMKSEWEAREWAEVTM